MNEATQLAAAMTDAAPQPDHQGVHPVLEDALNQGAARPPDPFDRRSGIGASLAPAVCGVSPFLSPLGAYLYLVGLTEGPEETDEMRWGNAVEAAILKHAVGYAETELRVGLHVMKPDTLRHRDYDHLYATPDMILADATTVDAKNVGAAHRGDWKEPGADGVPPYVAVQVQMQMACCSCLRGLVAASIMGAPPVYYHLPRSDELIRVIIDDFLGPFWQRVQERRPPEPDWTDPRTPELVQLLHRPTEGKVIELGEEAVHLADGYAVFGAAKKEAEDAQQVIKAKLAELMGDAETAILPDGRRVKRAKVACAERVQAAYEYQSFKLLKAPKG